MARVHCYYIWQNAIWCPNEKKQTMRHVHIADASMHFTFHINDHYLCGWQMKFESKFLHYILDNSIYSILPSVFIYFYSRSIKKQKKTQRKQRIKLNLRFLPKCWNSFLWKKEEIQNKIQIQNTNMSQCF